MHFSAKRGIAIACRLSVRPSVRPSVCNVGDSGPHRSEILELIAGTISLTSSLFLAQKVIHLLSGELGEILGRPFFTTPQGGVGKNGALEHKSGNISETRTDRGKVTMGTL